MKTEYTEEIKQLLEQTLTPATPDTEDHLRKSLSDLHTDVISILPAKWIDETDVYNALQKLEFKSFPYHNEEENKTSLFYFVSLKKN